VFIFGFFSPSEKMPKNRSGEDSAALPEPEKLQFNVSSDIKDAVAMAQCNLDK
jgi:hypothetical protein